jgi:Tol biopolymer transport system component
MTRLTLACLAAALVAGAASAAAPRAPGRSGGLILFWSDTPIPSLWSIRPDGTHRQRVYLTRQNCKRPSLSPDRRWIAFDGAPPGKPAMSDFDIQVVRRDGTGRRTVAGTGDREIDAQWSPAGTRISYERLRKAVESDWRKTWIWTVRPDGTGARALVHGNNARWSPDGRRLVFSAPTARTDDDLFVIGANGRGLRRVLATPGLEQPSAWSPDGRRILFTRYAADGSGSSQVYVVNVDGTHVRQLTRALGENVGGSWSPDGTRIVFTSTRLGRSHLFVMRANGTGERELTRRNADDFDPVWR